MAATACRPQSRPALLPDIGGTSEQTSTPRLIPDAPSAPNRPRAGAAAVPRCRGALTDACFSSSALTRGHRTHDTATPPRRLGPAADAACCHTRVLPTRGPRLAPRDGHAVLRRAAGATRNTDAIDSCSPATRCARRRF
ncbi:hypothetical protein KTR9_4931 (plasmid) [Gordonia sp. KTR9]|nr:hypothetical protein KTR9_4931 [Gordonia sp. KTR9]